MQTNHLGNATFFAGLAVCAGFHLWWPGILMVIALTLIVRGVTADTLHKQLIPVVILLLIFLRELGIVEVLYGRYVMVSVFGLLALYQLYRYSRVGNSVP